MVYAFFAVGVAVLACRVLGRDVALVGVFLGRFASVADLATVDDQGNPGNE